jgi:hypothetical protein
MEHALAQASGLNGKAVERILGSARVLVPRADAEPQQLELGFNLRSALGERLRVQKSLTPAEFSILAQRLREYSKCCPAAVSWIGRGDFDGKKVPELLTPAMLVHACRTAGRLRARVLKEWK